MTTAATWPDDGSQAEIPLLGGDVTEGIVRVGDTVRRPLNPNSPLVHALLRHLEAVGFTGPPLPIGDALDLAGVPEAARVEQVSVRRPIRRRATVVQRGQLTGLHAHTPLIRPALV